MFYLIVKVVLMSIVAVSQKVDPAAITALTARCRSHCLNKLDADGLTRNCFDGLDCGMCWDTCRMFYNNFKVWGPLCNEDRLCFPGCQESCDFYRSHLHLTEAVSPGSYLSQQLKYSYRPKNDVIYFEWSTPKGYNQLDPLVYVLLMRDHLTAGWQQLEQTFYQNVTVRRGLLKSSTRIRLISYDSNGKVSETEQGSTRVDSILETENAESMFSDAKRVDARHGDIPLDCLNCYWMPINNSLLYSTKQLGSVEASITWPKVSCKDAVKYEVEWKYTNPPTEITGRLHTNKTAVIVSVWPNRIYQVTVRAFSYSPYRPVAQSKAIILNTHSEISVRNSHMKNCYECVPIEYTAMIVGVVIALAALFTLLISLHARRHSADAEAPITPSFSNATTADSLAANAQPLEQHSLKKQLSLMGSRISRGVVNPTED